MIEREDANPICVQECYRGSVFISLFICYILEQTSKYKKITIVMRDFIFLTFKKREQETITEYCTSALTVMLQMAPRLCKSFAVLL